LSSAAFDTSALVKVVIDEPGSQSAREIWAAAEPPVCCRLAYVTVPGLDLSGRSGPARTYVNLATLGLNGAPAALSL
jgi:hypothetical protein